MKNILRVSPVLLLAACDPFVFDDLKEQAPTLVLEAPDSYPRTGFGRVTSTYTGMLGDDSVGRLAVSAGAGSPVRVYDAFSGGELHATNALTMYCDDPGDCANEIAPSFAGIPAWATGIEGREGQMCLIMPAPDSGNLQVRCETKEEFETLPGAMNERFGEATVALPAGSPLGVALIGAPEAGKVYQLRDAANPIAIEDLSNALSGTLGAGAKLAATELPDGSTLVAIAANENDGGEKRVVLLSAKTLERSCDDADDCPAGWDCDEIGGSMMCNRGGSQLLTTVRACINSDDPGFGGELAFGDLNHDGADELLIGDDSSAIGRAESVRIFDGASLPESRDENDAEQMSCPDSSAWTMAVELTCPDVMQARTVSCEGSGFGGAIRVGDLNGDEIADLVIGAPHASVDGTASAGVVFVYKGEEGSLSSLSTRTPNALMNSSPESGAQLGANISLIQNRNRFEIAAGAPGSEEVAVFLCSGIEGDTPDIGDRCMPDASE